MKARDRLVSVTFSSPGHYNVIVEKYGAVYKNTVTDMGLIDRYRDGNVTAADRLAVLAGRGKKISC